MADYTSDLPMTDETEHADGTITSRVTAIGRKHVMDPSGRVPAFIGLAKATGGWYAENTEGMDVDQALTAGGLNYTVQFAENPTATILTPDGVTTVTDKVRKAVVAVWDDGRNPEILGMVKSRYSLTQPVDLAAFGQAVVDEGGSNVVAAGAYGEPVGTRAYMAIKLPNGIKINGEDPHEQYLTLGLSHDGSTGLWGVIAPIRLACTNQTTATFGRGLSNRFVIRHTGDMAAKKDLSVRDVLRITGTWTERFNAATDEMLTTPLAGEQLKTWIRHVMPTPASVSSDRGADAWDTKRNAVFELATQAETNEFGRGTAYAAYQGLTEWLDHHRDVRDAKGNGRQYVRLIDGDFGERIKIAAFKSLVDA